MANGKAPVPDSNTIQVEVVVALPKRQEIIALRVAQGATIADALEMGGLATKFPDMDFKTCAVAVWGQPADSCNKLQEGDRIEVLRPLEIDPRKARRALAKAGQFMGGVTAATREK